MKIEDLIKRVDQLLGLGKETVATRDEHKHVDVVIYHQFRSASLSFILKIYGKDHPYFESFNDKINASRVSVVEAGIGILLAVKGELEGNWLVSTKQLLSAEIFSDFIEMASHLLDEGFKDAAAVMAGSVLEQELRTLAQRKGISTTESKEGKEINLKADRINAELARAEIYNKLDQKNITALLDLRNKAAHGQYGEYNDHQVKIMIDSIVEFLRRHV